ncbi:ASCH domain-containing protein [Candidatus Bipolaricaulota bacterium]
MSERRRRRIQFVSDALVQEIVDGIKTASVVDLGDVDVADGDYDDPLVVGELYDVYDSTLTVKATIRVVAMELCRWDAIPERLWRGEGNVDAEEFKADHIDYFENPNGDFEFIAYYFEKAEPNG